MIIFHRERKDTTNRTDIPIPAQTQQVHLFEYLTLSGALTTSPQHREQSVDTNPTLQQQKTELASRQIPFHQKRLSHLRFAVAPKSRLRKPDDTEKNPSKITNPKETTSSFIYLLLNKLGNYNFVGTKTVITN